MCIVQFRDVFSNDMQMNDPTLFERALTRLLLIADTIYTTATVPHNDDVIKKGNWEAHRWVSLKNITTGQN